LLIALGDVRFVQGDYEPAESLYARALRIAETAADTPSETLAIALDRYAAVLRQTDREADAAAVEERARSARARKANR